MPIVSVVIGEGGSGGALAIGVCDRLMMLQYSTYSVISPEGCASILWKSADKKEVAAEALDLTAARLSSWDSIDEVLEEPLGGAHRDPVAIGGALKEAVIRHLDELGAAQHASSCWRRARRQASRASACISEDAAREYAARAARRRLDPRLGLRAQLLRLAARRPRARRCASPSAAARIPPRCWACWRAARARRSRLRALHIDHGLHAALARAGRARAAPRARALRRAACDAPRCASCRGRGRVARGGGARGALRGARRGAARRAKCC